ncbi:MULTISPECIES: hypothetical protein, partial [Burkholderia]
MDVMVIVPVAFVAGAPKGADDQPTGQNTTFLKSYYNKCRSHFKMSGRQPDRNVAFSGVQDLFL